MKKTKKSSRSRTHTLFSFLPSFRDIRSRLVGSLRKQSLWQETTDSIKSAPRITNETIAQHREVVLRGARKYKYPLQHSKHRIVVVSTALLSTALIIFFVYIGLSLYRFQNTSLFTYRVTQVIPFPIAKADTNWVSYESYLFELRHYMHYYETQQQVDFSSSSGKFQLDTYKPKALQQVIDAAYVKELAAKNNVHVTGGDIDDAIALIRAQNQIGNSNQELASVTEKFFGWSLDDLKRQLKQELLAQKVAAKLDTTAYAKAQNVLLQLQNGADFATLAAQVSDDTSTKGNGGQYNDTAITMSSQEVPPQVVRQLMQMKVGETSGIITTPTSFEVVKLLAVNNGTYKAAHIQIHFNDIQTYLKPLEKKNPPVRFISVKALPY